LKLDYPEIRFTIRQSISLFEILGAFITIHENLSKSWNDDPQPKLSLERAAGSERKSGEFIRRTGRQQTRLNALIPREVKFPEGSGDGGRGQPNQVVEVQRAPGNEAAVTGAIRKAVVEPKGRTGTEAIWEEAK
jgi:hypothetical protein